MGMEWEILALEAGARAPYESEKIRCEPSSSLSLEQEDSIGVPYDPRTTFVVWFELNIGLALRLRRRLGLGVDRYSPRFDCLFTMASSRTCT